MDLRSAGILDKIAYPRMAAWVPLPLFSLNYGFGLGIALLVNEGIGPLLPEEFPVEILLICVLGLCLVSHGFLARMARKDPFVAMVLYQRFLPSSFSQPGARYFLRRKTRNLRPYPGRSYTV